MHDNTAADIRELQAQIDRLRLFIEKLTTIAERQNKTLAHHADLLASLTGVDNRP